MCKNIITDKQTEYKLRFQTALNKVLDSPKPNNSIGVLGEKTIHAVLKNFYSPDKNNQEIRTEGFVADVCLEHKIIEIQTRNFNTLRKKLDAFLPNHNVTIIYPLIRQKIIHWIDPKTGEISKGRKSPKIGSPYIIFKELYRIKPYLTNKNLYIKLAVLDIEEYKMLDGWSKDKKKGATRNDGIPTAFIDEISLETPNDYIIFLPKELPMEFTSSDLAKTAKLNKSSASLVLNILNHLNIVQIIGKKSRSYLYKINMK